MKIVKIKWLDSASDDGKWYDKEEYNSIKPVVCKSVGFVLKETDKYITIAHSVSPDQIAFTMAIPKFAIIKIKELK